MLFFILGKNFTHLHITKQNLKISVEKMFSVKNLPFLIIYRRFTSQL